MFIISFIFILFIEIISSFSKFQGSQCSFIIVVAVTKFRWHKSKEWSSTVSFWWKMVNSIRVSHVLCNERDIQIIVEKTQKTLGRITKR